MNKLSIDRISRPLAALVLAAGGIAMVVAVGSAAGSDPVRASAVDITRLPVGDGKVSLTTAQQGWTFACNAGNPNAGGAKAVGPWLDTSSGTFNLAAKTSVNGSVDWPSATISFKRLKSGRLKISGNGLPVGRSTGIFPVAQSDPAATYDRNPNSIAAQSISLTLPKPKKARSVSCLPGGAIGITTNGVEIFNALDGANRDAVAHEVLDSCGGHPQQSSVYHYHAEPVCVWNAQSATAQSPLYGYAFDGYPIYGPRGPGGAFITDAQLDACHGMTSTVTYRGKQVKMYHYVATLEYPYTLGCFRGTPIRLN